MTELTANILEGIGGIVIGIVGFFVGRYLRKDRVTESLARKNMLLDLREKMGAQGLNSEQLAELEREFEKQDRIREAEDRLRIESFDYGLPELHEAYTQADMNEAQARRLAMLDAKLGGVIAELSTYLDDDAKAKLNLAQEAWEKYRAQEAEWVARIWGDGTMAPLGFAAEATRLTIERLAALQAQLDSERAAFARYGRP